VSLVSERADYFLHLASVYDFAAAHENRCYV